MNTPINGSISDMFVVDVSMLPFSIDEYLSRQERFHSQLPNDSIVIIPSSPFAKRSNDTNFPYRANSYMLYLCGWQYPDAIFVSNNSSGSWNTSIFVQPNDNLVEIWEGRRIGVENAMKNWPVENAYSIENSIEKIKEILLKSKNVFIIQGLNDKLDDLVNASLTKKSRKRNVEGKGPVTIGDPSYIIDEMRLIKSEKEIEIMQKASDIASQAHVNAMSRSKLGDGEWNIQAIIEEHFISNKSRCSYGSIVGSGSNATILHYNSNDSLINDGDLVLIDAGCEVEGYASDITRTWPINGIFSEAQREIYELVLEAELAGINACKVGAPWKSSHHAASKVLAKGLIELGIINCSLDDALGDNFDGRFRDFFMHGTSHSLGLDVHDVGVISPNDEVHGRKLEEGMILTVEPGLYFAEWRTDIEVPSKYAGIGVRIEDDVLITKDGPIVLTSSCPKSVDEIEKIIQGR